MSDLGFKVEAVLFDLIGTLVYVEPIEHIQEKCMIDSLIRSGFALDESFIDVYRKVFIKYSRIRHSLLVEIPNNIWIAESLRIIGYDVEPSDRSVEDAVEDYFKPYIEAARPFRCVYTVFEILRDSGFNRFNIEFHMGEGCQEYTIESSTRSIL